MAGRIYHGDQVARQRPGVELPATVREAPAPHRWKGEAWEDRPVRKRNPNWDRNARRRAAPPRGGAAGVCLSHLNGVAVRVFTAALILKIVGIPLPAVSHLFLFQSTVPSSAKLELTFGLGFYFRPKPPKTPKKHNAGLQLYRTLPTRFS